MGKSLPPFPGIVPVYGERRTGTERRSGLLNALARESVHPIVLNCNGLSAQARYSQYSCDDARSDDILGTTIRPINSRGWILPWNLRSLCRIGPKKNFSICPKPCHRLKNAWL